MSKFYRSRLTHFFIKSFLFVCLCVCDMAVGACYLLVLRVQKTCSEAEEIITVVIQL
jgi:hypothetical protein